MLVGGVPLYERGRVGVWGLGLLTRVSCVSAWAETRTSEGARGDIGKGSLQLAGAIYCEAWSGKATIVYNGGSP